MSNPIHNQNKKEKKIRRIVIRHAKRNQTQSKILKKKKKNTISVISSRQLFYEIELDDIHLLLKFEIVSNSSIVISSVTLISDGIDSSGANLTVLLAGKLQSFASILYNCNARAAA